MPTVTVIIPVYKVERYLDACVESVVRQSYADLEILLVDDGSPDRRSAMPGQKKTRASRSSTGRTAACPPRATPVSTLPRASFCCSLTATTYWSLTPSAARWTPSGSTTPIWSSST